MLISQNEYLVENKGINHVISNKNGKEYDLKTLYLKNGEGVLTSLVVQNNIYEKAEVGKKYKIKVIMDYNGKFNVNDIELQK